jgi:hypothetical protein
MAASSRASLILRDDCYSLTQRAASGIGKVSGALGVRIQHPEEVAADVSDASEETGALAFVCVSFKFFNEFDLDQRCLAGDDKLHGVDENVEGLQDKCADVPTHRMLHFFDVKTSRRTSPRACRSV